MASSPTKNGEYLACGLPLIINAGIGDSDALIDQWQAGVLIEEFIEGREFTIGVFKTKGEIITLPVTEVKSKKEFFDFEAKYKGMSEEITPAEADPAVIEKVQAAARKIYSVLNCSGVVRIDFIYNEEKGQPYMLEVNSVPGQSAASIVPQQVKAMGWTLEKFYTALIEECWN